MPQLSIIVPYRSKPDAFEATLISVLENRPDHCEVIVPHNGSYTDPFDLDDEVRFVESTEDTLSGLVTAAVHEANSKVVHVLADGINATPGWTDQVAEAFDDESLGCASPIICDAAGSSRIVAAGWANDARRLRRRIASGATAVGRLESNRIEGVFLAASFWRTDLLLEIVDDIEANSTNETEAVWSAFIRESDFRIGPIGSRVTAVSDNKDLETNGFASQVARSAIIGQSAISVVGLSFCNCLMNLHKPVEWKVAAARIAAAFAGPQRSDAIRDSLDSALDRSSHGGAATIAFPQATQLPLRQAA